jgi:hypothetical protein
VRQSIAGHHWRATRARVTRRECAGGKGYLSRVTLPRRGNVVSYPTGTLTCAARLDLSLHAR